VTQSQPDSPREAEGGRQPGGLRRSARGCRTAAGGTPRGEGGMRRSPAAARFPCDIPGWLRRHQQAPRGLRGISGLCKQRRLRRCLPARGRIPELRSAARRCPPLPGAAQRSAARTALRTVRSSIGVHGVGVSGQTRVLHARTAESSRRGARSVGCPPPSYGTARCTGEPGVRTGFVVPVATVSWQSRSRHGAIPPRGYLLSPPISRGTLGASSLRIREPFVSEPWSRDRDCSERPQT